MGDILLCLPSVEGITAGRIASNIVAYEHIIIKGFALLVGDYAIGLVPAFFKVAKNVFFSFLRSNRIFP